MRTSRFRWTARVGRWIALGTETSIGRRESWQLGAQSDGFILAQGERLVARLPRLSSHAGYRLFRPVVMVITRRRWVQLIEGSPISRIFSSSHPLGESDAPGSLDHPSRILTPTKGCVACLCRGTFERNKLCRIASATAENISPDNAMIISHHCVRIYYIFILTSLRRQ